ncbi:protein FAR1-RELATED SEQUENCE 7-like isoform X1 [Typha angustifolia]|uniref:protein FAR1-RELATED SEQUENCE 7-like isoform X1 n=1 Tax=Typha angustifolia TaxID=59011 RepID=UPI003C2ABBD6
MVQLAEISHESLRRGDDPKQLGEEMEEKGVDEEEEIGVDEEEEEEKEKEGGGDEELREKADEIIEGNPSPLEKQPAAAKAPHHEYALRVAYIMRSYLHTRQGLSSGAGTGGGEEPCRAVMEVVRKENGRWSVSKAVIEHSHPLAPPPDPTGMVSSGGLVPVVGMEFDSISAAKAYYNAYGEKMGFEAKMGSGKRSRDSRILIMQRFMCSKGSFVPYRRATASESFRRKRGPYKKRAPKEGEGAEVIPIDEAIDKPEEGKKEATFGDNEEGTKPRASESASGKGLVASSNGKKTEKVPLVSNPGQSRLLRELGIRVSRYTHEERRDIILKYMQKRSSRQVVNRAIKIPSRQALAERRQRGVGGKFLSKEEMQMPNKQEESAEEEPELPVEVVANAGGVPLVGMVFENEEKAYEYYTSYAGNIGFSVRKGWWDKSAKNVTRSRVYVCSREGFRPKNDAKRPRPETRTGCPARMAIKITSSGKYRVTEFVSDHNHQLAAPLDIQLLKSQKLLIKVQPGDHENASLIPARYKNYLRTKRSKDMQVGDVQALLEYLQKMKGDNPSFYYAIQVDEYDKITNVFWADAKSMMDYHYFGDVLCLDTTYKVNGYARPFALFVGVNHHKQTVIFGAALLYDETVESFKWLFESFKASMCGKQPRTVLTDRCAAISESIAAIWPGTIHRFCVWQIYQNAVKHLAHAFEGSETFAHDFSQCIFDFEEEEEFIAAWSSMMEKYDLKNDEWLAKLYEERENWALVYGRQTFSADIKSTLQAESLGLVLKEQLNSDKDLSHFLKLYEILLEERRNAELQTDYQANQGTPRIPPLRLLWQAANVYTPAIFEIFRKEFDLFMNCIAYSCGEFGPCSEYVVTAKDKPKEHLVRFDVSNGTVICSCRKFEYVGIQCCHVLKVFDLRNIKELPQQYILKRWRKDAKCIRENNGFALDADSRSSIPKRYSSLCRTFYKIAAKAAENVETFTLMVGQSDQLLEQVEHILQTRLLEKPSVGNAPKGQTHNSIDSESMQPNDSNETQKVIGKRKSSVGLRRKNQNELEINKRQKTRKGHSDEAEIAARDDELHITTNSIPSQPRNAPNQFLAPNNFMQGPYVIAHQYGITQNLHSMTQFAQDTSASVLQQPPFPGNGHLTQSYPTSDMHGLPFVGTNPQLDHQSSDQGHCAIPVWDFL